MCPGFLSEEKQDWNMLYGQAAEIIVSRCLARFRVALTFTHSVSTSCSALGAVNKQETSASTQLHPPWPFSPLALLKAPFPSFITKWPLGLSGCSPLWVCARKATSLATAWATGSFRTNLSSVSELISLNEKWAFQAVILDRSEENTIETFQLQIAGSGCLNCLTMSKNVLRMGMRSNV